MGMFVEFVKALVELIWNVSNFRSKPLLLGFKNRSTVLILFVCVLVQECFLVCYLV